jgi:hypothetical protein
MLTVPLLCSAVSLPLMPGAGRKKVGKQEPLVSEAWGTLATSTISMLETVGAINEDAAEDCIEEAAQLSEMNKKRMVRAKEKRDQSRTSRALFRCTCDMRRTRALHCPLCWEHEELLLTFISCCFPSALFLCFFSDFVGFPRAHGVA